VIARGKGDESGGSNATVI
jgi:hypothetical protein